MKKNYPQLIYLTLVGAIIGPLFFQPGFVFLLDMVWAPEIRLSAVMAEGFGSGLPISIILKTLSFFLPLELVQKALLALILYLCAYLMFRLASQIMEKKWACLAGIFYLLNPFVYERFLAGHWLVLFGYALLPFITELFFNYLKEPNRKNLLVFSSAFALFPLVSLHWAYLSFFWIALCRLIHLFINISPKNIFRLRSALKQLIKPVLFTIFLFGAVNSFWLFSFFEPGRIITQINLNDFAAFATLADLRWGVFFNVLSLYGFWQDFFSLPKDFFSFWPMVTILVLGLSVLGSWQAFKRKNSLGVAVVMVFLPALVVAVGWSSEFSRAIIEFLYFFLPGFKGMRETAKIVGFLAFGYALLAPMGARQIGNFLADKVFPERRGLLISSVWLVVFIWPVLMANSIFWSFGGQLKAFEYPFGWQKVEELILADNSADRVLVLPWHGYPRLDWAGGVRVNNPAKAFFSFEVAAGRNLDSVYLTETEQPVLDSLVFSLLNGLDTIDSRQKIFQSEKITHILLLKIHDHDRYDFLKTAKQARLIFEDDDAALYSLDF